LLSSFVLAAIWVAQNQLSKDPSTWLASVLGIPKIHKFLSTLSISFFLIICALLWLFADREEALERIVETGLLFVPTKKLRPDHLSLVAFDERYVAHAEVADAQQQLSSRQLLLILGRPTGGKTRLAYNLAKQSKGHWILQIRPGFLDWKSLNFPRLPHRCKVLWIVDDVDKFLGKSDIPQGERVLGGKCSLKIVVTCRTGHELAQARSDKELAAFLERFPAVTCSDFSQAELVSFAGQVGKSIDPDLFDLTPGSVLLGLAEMRKRLDAAGPEAQAVLKAMFLLRTALIFSPEKKLVTAVVTGIYQMDLPDDKIEAATATLVQDGFLRGEQSLAPCHDCYLTTGFFPYYPVHSPRLEQDLSSLGDVVEQNGTARDLQSLGVYWKSRKNYERALPYLQSTAATNSRDPVLAFDLGVALYRTRRLDEALEANRRALGIDPDSAETLVNIGIILGELNRNEEAVQIYNEVLRRFGYATDPALRQQVAKALVNKGVNLGQLKLTEKEIQAYDEVLRRFGESTESALREHVARALVNKGVTLGELKRGEEEIQTYDEVLRRFGDATEPALRERVATALLYTGLTQNTLKRPQEARLSLREVLKRFADSPDGAIQQLVEKAKAGLKSLDEPTAELPSQPSS
jgi:tetratricopeptide (TPR) repeat protein